MLNNLIIFGSMFIAFVYLFLYYQRRKRQMIKLAKIEYNSLDGLVEEVKEHMVDLIRDDYRPGISKSEFDAVYKQKALISNALNECIYGKNNEKALVIELIHDFVKKNVEPSRVKELLGLDFDPTPTIKFEILLYYFKKKSEKTKYALKNFIGKYNLDEPRQLKSGTSKYDMTYYIDESDINHAYESENIELTENEQSEVLAILIYQRYKGMGLIDTIREMDIDGLTCGTSGSILTNTNDSGEARENFETANRGIWLFFEGKYIHLRFLNYENEDELKRIIQLVIKYGNPGALTAKKGYLINTMYDKSRVLAVRPPASEYWAMFIRKFTVKNPTPENLLKKEYTKNAELPIKLSELLMRAKITTMTTGMQGSGKTTYMSSIIRYINSTYTIRVLETAPELYLRELYPDRNILSVSETAYLSADELQDALKKSDGNVSIVGEVATDAIAANMIQMGQTASEQTIASHHGITTEKMVSSIRNSLVKIGLFKDQVSAEREVTSVIKIDVHMAKYKDGRRYMERVTEIVPLAERIPYPEIDENDLQGSFVKITKDYYERVTDRATYYTHDIIRYDLDTNIYYAVDMFTKEMEDKIKYNLEPEQLKEFESFMDKYWGERINDEGKCTKGGIIHDYDIGKIKEYTAISYEEIIDNNEEIILDLGINEQFERSV